MIVNQLSKSGYQIDNVFNNETLASLINAVNTFIPDVVYPGREVIHYHDGSLRASIVNALCDLPIHVYGVELWKDQINYTQPYHYDVPYVGNIIIVYLGGNNNPTMGTGYIEDGVDYKVNYNLNSGLVLYNSPTILHGMVDSVKDVDYRRVLYINGQFRE